MCKYLRPIFILFLLIVSLNLYPRTPQDFYLTPEYSGRDSKIINEHEIENYISKSKLESRYILEKLLYYDMGADTSFTYCWFYNNAENVDTLMVWIDPPAACSLLYYRMYVQNYFDSLNTVYANIFCAELDQSIDYYNDFNDANWLQDPAVPPYPNNPIESIVSEKVCTIPGGNWVSINLKDTLDPPHDFGNSIFGVGYIKDLVAQAPSPYLWYNFSGAPLPTHSILHGDATTGGAPYPGWYIHYSPSYAAPFAMFAKVRIYENASPEIAFENKLPDTYSQEPREVNIRASDFGLPPDSSGVEEVRIKYSVNGGSTGEVTCSMFSGDSTDGYWRGDIPGQSPGDTVVYWIESIDIQGDTSVTSGSSYIIRTGEPGHFLYVRDDFEVFDGGDIASILLDYFIDTIDVWNTKTMGQPDSSVFAYYTYGTGNPGIVWRSWGVSAFNGVDYGLGSDSSAFIYPDSNYLKDFLEYVSYWGRGGSFWLSDQDMGWGLGICPDYNHGNATGWVRNYLGAQGMYDDDAQLYGKCITAYSAGNPVLEDLFSGVGYQNVGEVYIAPYSYFDPTMGWSYSGSYDSLVSGTVQNMFDVNGRIFSYAYRKATDSISSDSFRVWMDFWPFDYIANPADSTHMDTTAVDTYAIDVLKWLKIIGRNDIVEENPLNPDEITHLFSIQPVTDKALIQYFLPEKTPVSLDVYDLSGRKIKNLVNEIREPGLNTCIWNCRDSEDKRVPSGIYFIHLTTEDANLTEKIVVLR